MRKACLVLSAALVVTMTACNGSSSGGGDAGGKRMTAQQVADKIGCTGMTNDDDELYVHEGGDCTYNDKSLTIADFANAINRDNWLKVALGFGGVYGVGDYWTIGGDDRDSVEAATQAAGGTIKP
jgi:hypothetical protein